MPEESATSTDVKIHYMVSNHEKPEVHPQCLYGGTDYAAHRCGTGFSRCGSLVMVNGTILTSRQIIEQMEHLGRQ